MENDRRQKILNAAYEVIKEEGLPFLSYDSISNHSGVSRQLIRYYFASKDDLMIAICDLLATAYRETLVDVARGSMSDSKGRLEYLLDFYFDFLDGKKKPKDDQIYDAMMSLAAGSPAVQDNLRAQYCLLGNVMAHEISIEYPKMSIPDANQLSYLFVSFMYGHWKMVASLGLSEKHNQITRKAIDRLIESFLRKPSKPSEQIDVWL